MTAVMEAPVTGDTPPLTGKRRNEMTLCGHCRFPNREWPGPGNPHVHCPRAVRNGANAEFKIITCECPEPGCGEQVLQEI